jgi:hypothetical protein
MAARPPLLAFLACALLTLGGAPARQRQVSAEPPRPRPVGPTGVVLPAFDPMAAEMQRELERSQREYAGLYQRLAEARDETEAFAIQEQMRQQRTALQISLLRIQAAYARRAGRNALAAQLDRAVAALIEADPPARSAPDGRRTL